MDILGWILAAFAVYLGLENRSRLNALNARLAAPGSGEAKEKTAAAAAPPPPPPPPLPEAMPAARPAEEPQTKEVDKPSLEERLGARWAVWVGGISLALGGIFLARYSIEAGLLGPGARITLGALFSAALIATGEWFRRKGGAIAFGMPSAHIPSILTAAGTVAAFATTFSAHALYGFIGPGTTFVLLGIIAIACLLAAALHGPWLAGLGLIGATIVPLLVSSDEPNAWALFMHITVVTGAALALARLRGWTWLAITAGLLALAWGLFYAVALGHDADSAAILAFVFAVSSCLFAYHASGENNGMADLPVSALAGGFGAVALIVLTMKDQQTGVLAAFTLLLVFFLAVAYRLPRLTPVIAACLALSVCAALFWNLEPQLLQDSTSVFPLPGEPAPLPNRVSLLLAMCAVYGALFLSSGVAVSFLTLARNYKIPMSWAGLAALGPFLLLATAYWRAAGFAPEIRYAAVAGALAAIYAALTARFLEREARQPAAAIPTGFFAAGSAGALALGLAMILRDGYLTVAISLLAAGLAWVYSQRPINALRILALIAGVIVIVCTAYRPLIIEFPGTTPIFNALLWGYGLPAAAFAAAAMLFRRSGAEREAGVFEALALVYTALLFFFEIRHWAHGGDMLAPAVSTYETGLNAVVAFLLAVAVDRLSIRLASPVLSAAVSVLGAAGAMMATLGLVVLNPMVTGEIVGDGPFLPILVLGYFAPAAAAAIYAVRLRGRSPDWQAQLGAVAALVLVLMYASLEVRSAFHAPDLVSGVTTDAEQYTYSVVWLALGIALLAAGALLRSRVVRLGSALVIVLVVLKVFLLDMNDLGGMLRALSFMGLGVVLVGIGAIYQRLLFPRSEPV